MDRQGSKPRQHVTRRAVMGATGAGAAVVVLAACGAGEQGAAAGSAGKTSASVTLTYMSPNNAQRLQRLRTVFDAFTQEHPNVRVEINPQPEGQTWDAAVLVRHQGGDTPDAMEFVTYWHHLQPTGLAVDLTPLMKRSKIEPSRFITEPITSFTVGAMRLAVPRIAAACGMIRSDTVER